MDGKEEEEENGFAFTTCFRCRKLGVTRYGNRSLPKQVKCDCEVDNGIVMILCGLCKEMDRGTDNTESFYSDFRKLRLNP